VVPSHSKATDSSPPSKTAAVQSGTAAAVFMTESRRRLRSQTRAASREGCTAESFLPAMIVNASNRPSPSWNSAISMMVPLFCTGTFGWCT